MFRSLLVRAFGFTGIVVLGLLPITVSQAQEDPIGVSGVTAPEGKGGCPIQNRSFLQVCTDKRKIPDVSGTYTGKVDDSVSGIGTLSLSVVQKQNKITGLWSTSYPNGQSANGNLSGTVSKTAIRATLGTHFPHCSYRVIATISPNEFQGTFVDTPRCPQDDSGSFVIERQ